MESVKPFSRQANVNVVMNAQRIVYFAKPAKTHPELCEWETAQIVLFLLAGSREEALSKAQSFLSKRNWTPVRLILHTVVEEALALKAGAEIWDAFQTARQGKIFWRVFPDTFGTGHKRSGAILSPSLGEAFIDKMIAKAGGRRLTAEEKNHEKQRNADYLLSGWIFELKDLQEEGLEKIERQEKLAAFYTPERRGDAVSIAPENLRREELREYLDIVGGPIQTQVKSASKQIRQTLSNLRNDQLRGGLIFLNTGYGSLPPALFEMLVERYARKDSTQIEQCISISAWVLTNGFDWNCQFKFHPHDSPDAIVQLLEKSFSEAVDEFMTRWARSGFQASKEALAPLKPIAFEIAGRNFTWEPPEVPRNWEL